MLDGSDDDRAACSWICALADLARDLQGRHPDPAAAARLVTVAALQLVPVADLAAVTVVGKDRSVTTLGPTDPALAALDTAQQESAAGPCLTALWAENVVVSADLGTDERWPGYAQAALQVGVRSVLAIRLFVREAALGALGLYARRPDAFDAATVQAAQAFAGHAAVALDQARHREQLASALAGRDVIGQAKGILMERHRVDENAAFALLVRSSQAQNLPLRQVAERLTYTGQLPLPPG